MKNLTILVAIVLFSCYATSQVTASDLESMPSLRNKNLEWWHYNPYPYFHPKPPHWPFPCAGEKAFPPLPSGYDHPRPFHPPLVVTKCLSDCKDVRKCMADINKAFFTRKPDIGSECCASIQKMDEDCDKTVFGAYHNFFFDSFVKLHCATKAGSTPSAPSPA